MRPRTKDTYRSQGVGILPRYPLGQSRLIKPPSLLFKDPTVTMQLHVEYPQSGVKFWRSWGNRYLWLRLWGPGRVAVQSAYEAVEDPGTNFQSTSGHTEYRW